MATTFIKIASVTVGSGGVSDVTFSSIPQIGYTDLLVKVSARLSASAITQSGAIYFNTAAADSSYRTVSGNGSTTSSINGSGQNEIYAGEWVAASATASTFSNTEIYIPNYTGSQQKSISVDSVSENNAATTTAMLVAGLSTKTAAISSITLRPFSGGQNIVQYSTFTLYGIKSS
jgi:hypothetical protein